MSSDLVYQRFPDQELVIRRMLKTDDCIRAICSDYCEAQSALIHSKPRARKGSGRVAQYRTLVDELAEEIVAHLRRADSDHAGSQGAYADLILVDGKPLEDLDLVTDPHTNFDLIMKNGVFYKNTI